MDCATLAAHLTDFLEGELAPEEEMAALDHLSSCHACEVVLAETRTVVDLAQDHGRVPLTDDDRDRMLHGVIRKIDE